jgi:hypothetical protein
MNKIYDVADEAARAAVIPTVPPPAAHPGYLSLSALVAVVGAASLLAWWCTDHSLETRAGRGEAQAQYLLGKQHFNQAINPQDYVQAARLIRQAANQGYARAQTAMGLLYENGLGVPRDYRQAVAWLRRAADQGYPVAQNELGIMYAKGHGFARNLEQAAHWCRLAAAQGSEEARRNLQLAQVAQAKVIPELTTLGNKTYRHVSLQKLDPEGVTFSFRPTEGGLGVARLKLENLPQELQELCRCADKKGIAPDSAYSQLGSISRTL